MNLDDIRELDLSNIGGWPMAAKAVVIALVCAIIAGAAFYLDTMPQLETRDKLVTKEHEKVKVLKIRAGRAAELVHLKVLLKQMNRDFKKMRLRLPTDTQVAVLLENISQKGRAAGLEFKLYDPLKDIVQQDFVEIPIKIQVVGHYHQLGRFISEISELHRIVTLHDINIRPLKKMGSLLEMTVLAKTYKYQD